MWFVWGTLFDSVHAHVFNCALGLTLFFFVFLNQLPVSGIRWQELTVWIPFKGINTRHKETDRRNPTQATTQGNRCCKL